ncbi:MAG: lipid A export permease/ATP-binding protein MsbA [Coxiellaceae bacterium]|jgi:subfamily B ATP-binding cassette protein MsbA|nr:lipid A export permease/ATP-binding protein MsbA [Coxiellaceae bacterium]
MNKLSTTDYNHYNGKSIYLRLLRSIITYWFSFVLGIVGTILAAGTDATITYAIKPLLSNWDLGKKSWWFGWLPVIIITILVIRGITYFLSTYYLTRVGRNIVRDFRQRIFEHLMYLPVSYYDHETSGKLLSILIYNTEQVAGAATDALITILQEGMLLIGLIIVILSISWQLTLMFLITAPVVFMIIRYTSKRLHRLSSGVQDTMGNLAQTASEGIENYKVVRIFGGENHEKQKFFSIAHQNRQREMKVIAASVLGTSLTQIITSIPLAVIIFIATNTYLYHNLNASSISAFVFAIVRLLTPLRRLTKINNEIQKGVAGAQSIFALLDEAREIDLGTKTLLRAKGKTEYRNVSFNYPGTKKTILHNINFTIESGQTVAIVGSSGSGKSTLINLLPRFYDINEGEILIDNINIQNYKLIDLRKQFAIVSQHLTLFNDTIANNIAYGSHQETAKNKIIQVAETAYIMDFIKHLPFGLDTLIGENGLLLSGGQRQRIAIARALLKNAPILILDEATSALDTESENHIRLSLKTLMNKCTTFVIAHRLSTIEHADKIIVLDHGKIVETGTHAELLGLHGQYAKLHNLQFKL